MTFKFDRIAAGRYADKASGWTIERQGPATGRHDRADWTVRDAEGAVVRVRQTFAEAEIAAHKALSEDLGGGGAVAVVGDTPPPSADAPAVGSPAYLADTLTIRRMRAAQSAARNRVTGRETRTDADALRDTRNHAQGAVVHAADKGHARQLQRAGLIGPRQGLTRKGSIVAERLREQALDDAFGPL